LIILEGRLLTVTHQYLLVLATLMKRHRPADTGEHSLINVMFALAAPIDQIWRKVFMKGLILLRQIAIITLHTLTSKEDLHPPPNVADLHTLPLLVTLVWHLDLAKDLFLMNAEFRLLENDEIGILMAQVTLVIEAGDPNTSTEDHMTLGPLLQKKSAMNVTHPLSLHALAPGNPGTIGQIPTGRNHQLELHTILHG
jgi:hypothetical protein